MYSQAGPSFATQHYSRDSAIWPLPQHQAPIAPCPDVFITVTYTPFSPPSTVSAVLGISKYLLFPYHMVFLHSSLIFSHCFWLFLASVLWLLSWGLFTSLLLCCLCLLFCTAHSLREKIQCAQEGTF